MIKIRIGKDIIFRWAIQTNGLSLPLSGRRLTLEIVDPYGSRIKVKYETDGNCLIFKFRGIEHRRTGVHGITLWENKDEEGQTAVDISKAFVLVRTTEEEDFMSDSTGGTSGGGTQVIGGEYAVYVGLSAGQLVTAVDRFNAKDIPKGEFDLKDEYPDF